MNKFNEEKKKKVLFTKRIQKSFLFFTPNKSSKTKKNKHELKIFCNTGAVGSALTCCRVVFREFEGKRWTSPKSLGCNNK